jgi:hypothetical protein
LLCQIEREREGREERVREDGKKKLKKETTAADKLT